MNTCHIHSLLLLGLKSYTKWHGGPTLALRPAATLPIISVPSGAPSIASHTFLTG